MAEERLDPVVADPHRLPGDPCQQRAVDLQGDVLASTERSADPGEGEPYPVLGDAQTCRDLLAIGVQPLGGDPHVDTAVRRRHHQRGLAAEEGLVLHAHHVGVADLDLATGVRVTVPQMDLAEDVAVGMQRIGVTAGVHDPLGIGHRR